MSELLDRAAQLGEARRRAQIETAAQYTIDEAERNAKSLAARAESSRRVAEFVSIMVSKGVPHIPLYQEIKHKGSNPGNMSIGVTPDRTLRWTYRANGWVVREPAYPYDEEPVQGLFVALSKDYYICNETLKTANTGSVPAYVRAGIVTPEFTTTNPFYDNIPGDTMEPASERSAHFAGEQGLGILAHALARLGIEK